MSDDTITVKVEGLEELQRRLNDLPKRQAQSALRKALREGAKVFKDAVIREAPKESGFLSQHFKINTRIRGVSGAAYVTPDKKITYPADSTGKKEHKRWAYLVAFWTEFGTTTHRANPFLTRAFESTKAAVLDRVIEALRDLLNPR
jgi:HK97 gp10 family phage protein